MKGQMEGRLQETTSAPSIVDRHDGSIRFRRSQADERTPMKGLAQGGLKTILLAVQIQMRVPNLHRQHTSEIKCREC